MADNKSETAAAPKKRRAPQGPRKVAPAFIVAVATDSEGNLLTNAKVQVVLVTKDAMEAFRVSKATPGSDIQPLELGNTSKPSDTPTA